MNSDKKLPTVLTRLLLLAVILAAFGAGLYVLFIWLTAWEQRLLFGLLTLCVLMLVLMFHDGNTSKQAAADMIPDAATAAEQQAAIDHLAALPHYRKLSDGTLFDYLQGSYVTSCHCGMYSPYHLMVRYGEGRRHAIALVSRSALSQFLALQDAVAVGLERALPQIRTQQAENAGGAA